MSDHHQKMIRFSLDHIIFVEQQVRAIDAEISRKIVGAGSNKRSIYYRAFPALSMIAPPAFSPK